MVYHLSSTFVLGLNGCIRELSTRMDSTPTELIQDAIVGADIGECPELTACERNQCLNGGTCTNVANDFVCECSNEFFGRFCETRVCQSNNPCQNQWCLFT